MRQVLFDEWSIDLGPEFSTTVRDEFDIVCTKPGMRIGMMYGYFPAFDPAWVIRDVVVRQWARRPISQLPQDSPEEVTSEFSFDSPDQMTDGYATKDTRRGPGVRAIVASYDRLVELGFRLSDESQIPEALTIWRSLRYHAEDWVRLCAEAKPSLYDLRRALLFGPYSDEGREVYARMEEQQRAGDAMGVLVAALRARYWRHREHACMALQWLGQRTQEILQALRIRLDDEHPAVRQAASYALLTLSDEP